MYKSQTSKRSCPGGIRGREKEDSLFFLTYKLMKNASVWSIDIKTFGQDSNKPYLTLGNWVSKPKSVIGITWVNNFYFCDYIFNSYKVWYVVRFLHENKIWFGKYWILKKISLFLPFRFKISNMCNDFIMNLNDKV